MKYIIYLLITFCILSTTSFGMPSPESYGKNECHKIAQDYQREFGGSLIWIQPIDEQRNAILSDFGAHVINKVYEPVSKQLLYVDWGLKSTTIADFEIRTLNGKPARSYDLSKERPEFGLIWYY